MIEKFVIHFYRAIDEEDEFKDNFEQDFLTRMETNQRSKNDRLKNIKSELDDDNEQDCPFAPKISMRSREIAELNKTKPIHERYKEVQK